MSEAPGGTSASLAAPSTDATQLAAGFLAAVPLFLAYELGLALGAEAGARSTAERVVDRALVPFGERATWVRCAALCIAAVLSYVHLRSREGLAPADLGRRLSRSVAEGGIAGIVLGPLLVFSVQWLGAAPLVAASEAPRSAALTLRLVGAAPWEEVLFRLGVFSLVFLVHERIARFLGVPRAVSRLTAEWLAFLGSSLAFALFHLQAFQQLLGSSGEPFHAGLFLWRVTAGLFLAALFRWRGLGVSSWAHAVFNLGIALGVRP